MVTSYVELPAYSMFASTPIYEVDGNIVFGLLHDPVVAHASDEIYVVPPAAENRLDLISDHFYDTPELWWVIAMVNNFADVLTSPTAGQRIAVPTRERLTSIGLLNV